MTGFEYSQKEFEQRAGGRLGSGAMCKSGNLVRAAVLVAVTGRRGGAHIILTRRPQSMAHHGGQIAFPGGKIEPGDGGPVNAALREAHEETGLDAGYVNVLGVLEDCNTSTGFQVTPVVGIISPGFRLQAEEREVEEIFEVPLSFLMDSANHQTRSGVFDGRRIKFPVICYDDYYIWGATARMLIQLYSKVYAS